MDMEETNLNKINQLVDNIETYKISLDINEHELENYKRVRENLKSLPLSVQLEVLNPFCEQLRKMALRNPGWVVLIESVDRLDTLGISAINANIAMRLGVRFAEKAGWDLVRVTSNDNQKEEIIL